MPFWKQEKTNIAYTLYVKSGAIFLLFLLSFLIVACGSNPDNTNLGQPAVTVTINLNQSNGSPTPPLQDYTCSAWVTNTSPGINTPAVGVYAKFVHNVDGNPEGVSSATGTATVLWPDGNSSVITAPTTSDGLAVFSVSTANRSADMNKIVLVTVSFQGPGAPPCNVNANQAAFFTLGVPTGSPTAGPGTPTGSPTPELPKPTPTPCPPHHKHCH